VVSKALVNGNEGVQADRLTWTRPAPCLQKEGGSAHRSLRLENRTSNVTIQLGLHKGRELIELCTRAHGRVGGSHRRGDRAAIRTPRRATLGRRTEPMARGLKEPKRVSYTVLKAWQV
jgi:hypothetical protein